MKYIFIALTTFLLSCTKVDDQINNAHATGQLYFWNPYPLSDLGSGVNIYVDGVLQVKLMSRYITNGFYVQRPIGVHEWSYSVTDGITNYSNRGKITIIKNATHNIEMIKP